MGRCNYIDIAKGLLIILVVVGHTYWGGVDNIVHSSIFWFHIPAFFVISGIFQRVPENNPLINVTYLRKMLLRYVLPYFSWCVALYLVFRFEPLGKNFFRVLYGGTMNSTVYAYPFWFINSLFITSLLFQTVLWYNRNKSKGYILKLVSAILFVVAHVSSGINVFIDLPWAFGQSLLCFAYMTFGYLLSNNFRTLSISKLSYWSIIVAIVLVAIVVFCGWSLNIKSLKLPNVIVDLIIPLCATYGLLNLCLFIDNHTRIVAKILKYVGQRSMTIMFTHAAILYALTHYSVFNFSNVFVLGCLYSFIAVALGVLIHNIISRNKFIGLLFNGK